ncbi:MAG: hypothetical protein JW891_17705 [Candidatus Lokiarchaeota archaeon]|nr:hypothetical protein [Candidatus Lokiarchaeota archaeon]
MSHIDKKLEDFDNNLQFFNSLIKEGGKVSIFADTIDSRLFSVSIHDVNDPIDLNSIYFERASKVFAMNCSIVKFAMKPERINKSIREITLIKCTITNLEHLQCLKALKSLAITRCGLSSLQYIRDLPELETLNVSENEFVQVDGLENLPSLNHLDIKRNKLASLNGFESLKSSRSLREIDASENDVKDLDQLRDFRSLTCPVSLYLSRNKIKELDLSTRIEFLTYLDLKKNDIREIKALENLPFLDGINLDENPIEKIEHLKNLPELRSISVFRCPIRYIDLNIFDDLPSLDQIGYLGCGQFEGQINYKPFVDFDLEVGSKSYSGYLKELRDKVENYGFAFDFDLVDKKTGLNFEMKRWYEFLEVFDISEYISVRLVNDLQEADEEGMWRKKKTLIYVNGKIVLQCSYLLMNLSVEKASEYGEFDSINEIMEQYDHSYEQGRPIGIVEPEEEFWGHCSNIQAWYEHDYDTRILDVKVAFPILKELAASGDEKAKKVFKDEIALRYSSGFPSVVQFIEEQGYLEYFTKEELGLLKGKRSKDS